MRLDVDIRDTDDARRDGVMQAAFAAAQAIAQRRRCGLRTETVFAYPAATSDEQVQQRPSLMLQFPKAAAPQMVLPGIQRHPVTKAADTDSSHLPAALRRQEPAAGLLRPTGGAGGSKLQSHINVKLPSLPVYTTAPSHCDGGNCGCCRSWRRCKLARTQRVHPPCA